MNKEQDYLAAQCLGCGEYQSPDENFCPNCDFEAHFSQELINELPSAIHTLLRKNTQSNAAVDAYFAILQMPEEEWAGVVRLAIAEILGPSHREK